VGWVALGYLGGWDVNIHLEERSLDEEEDREVRFWKLGAPTF
jgi:hypothetical protein